MFVTVNIPWLYESIHLGYMGESALVILNMGESTLVVCVDVLWFHGESSTVAA